MSADATLKSRGAADMIRSNGQPVDIVFIAVSNWGIVKSNPEYTILDLAARGHRVLVVEPFESISSILRMARIQKRKVGTGWGLRVISENIWAYRPPPLAMPGQSRTPLAASMSGRLLAGLINRCIGKLGFHNVCLWSFMYNTASLLEGVQADFKIYESGDEDAALAQTEAQRRTVLTLDAATCKAADIVFGVTEEICAPRRRHNVNAYAVNCGADVEFFGKALTPDAKVPDAIATLPKPIIGYIGSLDPWKIDIPLLIEMARQRPEWSIVFVGYVWFGFDRAVFDDVKNIHILGPQDYADLPLFMKGMDVGLMPFPLNEITRNGDALKCYEYLAAGLAVVSRDVPVARRLSSLVSIADTPDEFVAACEQHLSDDPDQAILRNRAMAGHDWSRRIDQKIKIISEHFH